MTVRKFSLEELIHLDDGRVAQAWQYAVRRAISDCEDRPGHEKPRKVTLELELTPQMHQSCLDSIDAAFKVKETLPVRESKKYNLGVRRLAGQKELVFNDLADDDIDQRTLDELPGVFPRDDDSDPPTG